ncbi:MAG: hypothetical protein ACE5JS_17980 [Nitrospinota bacterium]
MKRAIVIGLAVLLGIALIGYAVADSRHGPGWGMMGSGPGWMHRGSGHGPGWMHRGFGSGPGYGGGFGPCQQLRGEASGEKLTKDGAESIVNRHLAFSGNPNLKLGSVKEETGGFVAEIVTKEGSLVDRLRIDRETGFIRPIR